jgi:L-glutamine-phosphate cytidylyltransferase
MKYRAIILAAGRGSRMGKETDCKPKCLTILRNKTLLESQTEALKSANITDINIIGGYRREMLTDKFPVIDNENWENTNMVYSLFCAPAFNGITIVSYSDIVYHAQHVKDLLKSKSDIAITADKSWEELWKMRFENPLDDAETFKCTNGKLMEIGQKTNDISNIEAQYMGLLKLTPAGWKTAFDLYNGFSEKEKTKMDMTTLLNELLKRRQEVDVVIVDGKWCEVDSYADVLLYENEIRKNNHWKHDWR